MTTLTGFGKPAVRSEIVHETPTAVEANESHYIRRAQQGDMEAFDWLIARHRDRALRLAFQILRQHSDAEDLVQEAFLRAFAQIRSFRLDCTFYTWLYRIVVRLSINRMKSPDWQRSVQNELIDINSIPSHSQPAPSENRMLVEKLLSRLSPPLRLTLILREMEGLEYEEIASTLNIPVGTVRSRLSAARAQFQSLWLQIQEETQNV